MTAATTKKQVATKKEIQSTKATTKKYTTSVTTQATRADKNSGTYYSPSYFKKAGVLRYNGYRWTYYSSRILPGYGLKIPGRHTDSNGYICDEDGYICLASSTLKKGTILSTPLGKQGKVYDCGCAVGTVDVYVNW